MSPSATLFAIARLGLGLGGRAARANRRRRLRRLALAGAALVFAALCFLAAFAAVAAFIYLILRGPLGPAYATLVLAAAMLALGGGLLILVRKAPSLPLDTAHQVGLSKPLLNALSAVIASNGVPLVLAAALAGIVAGSSRGTPQP